MSRKPSQMEEIQWEIPCLMDDHDVTPLPGIAGKILNTRTTKRNMKDPDQFSFQFLQRDFVRFATIGQLRKIIDGLQFDAREQSCRDLEDFLVSLSDAERLDDLCGLAIQLHTIEVCEEELKNRRRPVHSWSIPDGLLKTLNQWRLDWRTQARNQTTSVPKLSIEAEATIDDIHARGMGTSPRSSC